MRASRLLLGALVAAQVAYPRVPERRRPAATRGVVGLMLATSVADAAEARGPRRAAALDGAAAAIGFATEVAGVATGRPFGHYAYGPGLGPRMAGVPLLAAAAWTMMARPSWVVAGHLTRRPPARAVLAAAALAAWDVFLDPRMAREGYWTWGAPGRYEGIPLSNFAGWLATGTAVFAAWAALDPGDDPLAPDGRLRAGDGALALYAWTLAGETIANLAFWGRPRVAAAGGAAMGALAAPALARRLAAGRP
ncbi:MAG TPA: carotenoid biosynthesis protein [Solirubrobacteraceae bacterium]|nr:carotenoid biosynthesis protein [Solirubrobacteraceae bacterium]